jgi:hypothetical protein
VMVFQAKSSTAGPVLLHYCRMPSRKLQNKWIKTGGDLYIKKKRRKTAVEKCNAQEAEYKVGRNVSQSSHPWQTSTRYFYMIPSTIILNPCMQIATCFCVHRKFQTVLQLIRSSVGYYYHFEIQMSLTPQQRSIWIHRISLSDKKQDFQISFFLKG